jgi:hypothetical protein
MRSCNVFQKRGKNKAPFYKQHNLLFFFFFVPPRAECRAFRNQDRKSTPSPERKKVEHVDAGRHERNPNHMLAGPTPQSELSPFLSSHTPHPRASSSTSLLNLMLLKVKLLLLLLRSTLTLGALTQSRKFNCHGYTTLVSHRPGMKNKSKKIL